MGPAVAESVRGMPRICVTDTYRLAPDADALVAHDLSWWRVEPGALEFAGLKIAGHAGVEGVEAFACPEERVELRRGHVLEIRTSGLMAIRVAAAGGARRVELYGFEAGRGGSWRPEASGRLEADELTRAAWSLALQALIAELAGRGVEVVAGGEHAALDLAPVPKAPLLVHGMAGLGDCLHQRGVVRELSKRWAVWLRTPWPQLFHDLPGVRCVPRGSGLRTQDANEARSAELYATGGPPAGAKEVSLGYWPAAIAAHGSIVEALAASARVPASDFRLPVPAEWIAKALAAGLPKRGRVLVYRPLVARAEWPGWGARNPDPGAYRALFRAIRKRFFVVSVANLAPGVEWLVEEPVGADLELHGGELDVEGLVGLYAAAALSYSSPGFGTVLAQAVGTPGITVFGGFERAAAYTFGATLTPWLPVEPVTPCACYAYNHACDKRIDLDLALAAVERFAHAPHGYHARDRAD